MTMWSDIAKWCVGLALGVCASGVWAYEITAAKVTRVVDGDTIHVQSEGGQRIKVRFAGIDCPERDQPWGNQATKALSKRLSGHSVDIKVVDIDRYGRTVGRVFLDGQNINRELVETGNCWAYTRYVKDAKLFELEREAKAASRGLWSLAEVDRLPPWDWRRLK
mgnify:CR=1 FL=1